MDIFNIILYQPLSWVLNLCYSIVGNYGIAIFMFTFLVRLIMLPTAINQQKGTAKQIRMKPKLQKLQKKYGTDRKRYNEEMSALYEREGYNPMNAGCLPMLIQLPIMIGLYNVIYNPLTYILRLDQGLIKQATDALSAIGAIPEGAALPAGAQLLVVDNYQALLEKVPELAGKGIESLMDSLYFLGLNLTKQPSFNDFNILWLIPLFSGLTSFAVSFLTQRHQKKVNPEMSRGPMMGCMTFGMPLFSVYIAFTVPGGVGFYWISSNIIAFLQTMLVHKLYGPEKVVARQYVIETIERRSKEKRRKELAAE